MWGTEDLVGVSKKQSSVATVGKIDISAQEFYSLYSRQTEEIRKLLGNINDEESRIVATAEREVLKVLEGDCNTAVGVYAKINGEKVNIIVELFSVDGKKRYFFKESTEIDNIKITSRHIGEKLKEVSKGSYKN